MRGSGFMNIITESEMIDLLNDYLDSSSLKPMIVGGIIGTDLFQYAIDAATSYTKFEKVLVVEGIQDFIGLHEKIAYGNHRFYAELFENRLVMVPRDKTSLESFFLKDPVEKVPTINTAIHANVMIINDAHVIPENYLKQLIYGHRTKVICIVDPFDIGGEPYANVPTIVDTLHKLPNLMIRARGVYNIDSRAMDKTVSSILDKAKVQPRSVGRIDENQYITNDDNLIKLVHDRQREQPFKKHQKLMIRDKYIIHSVVKDDSLIRHDFPLTEHSMITIAQTGVNMLYLRMRVWSSKAYIYAKPTYDKIGTAGNIHVDPANVLSVHDAHYHRYKHAIYVPNGVASLTRRECYALLKSTTHLTIAE